MAYCQKCGAKIEANENYCPSCGSEKLICEPKSTLNKLSFLLILLFVFLLLFFAYIYSFTL
ncbi:zinc-ribbon domain-containing protein [Candidatus Woesearchaeota archaeon]|nr:zinc-ribbon domain-containing protein [Candidatus Woesearchaeota archaeon]